jgi:hypothetical protein
VRLIQQVEWRRPVDLLASILNLPGIYCTSQLLMTDINIDIVMSMSAITPSTLAHVVAGHSRSPYARSKYIMSLAPVNHANVFGGLQFTGLGVNHLTVKLLGTSLWDYYYIDDAI